MTTIAYKDGVIACDGRMTSGQTICTDDQDKRIVREDGVQFFLSGDSYLQEQLVAAWPDGQIDGYRVNAFVIDAGKLYFVCIEEGKICRSIQSAGEPWSIGSGSDHALTAMDMGATAEEAVKAAIKRDTCTGGTVRTYEVANGPA